MSATLPYVSSYGLIDRLLPKIIEAETPPRFTQDYLGTNLGMTGGNAMTLIGLLKKIGFLGSDGVPLDPYKKFRNEAERGAAMAGALKHGYKALFSRNEYAHKLEKEKLQALITELTGAAQDASSVRQIVGTFEALKKHADFEAKGNTAIAPFTPAADATRTEDQAKPASVPRGAGVGMNLSYTINLNLPATSDIAVFNAIFRSLNEHLLKELE